MDPTELLVVVIVFWDIHGLGSECSEPCPLPRLGISISPYFIGPFVLHADITLLNLDSDEETPVVNKYAYLPFLPTPCRTLLAIS